MNCLKKSVNELSSIVSMNCLQKPCQWVVLLMNCLDSDIPPLPTPMKHLNNKTVDTKHRQIQKEYLLKEVLIYKEKKKLISLFAHVFSCVIVLQAWNVCMVIYINN